MAAMLGTAHDAALAALGWQTLCPCGCENALGSIVREIIGRGESRTAWLINGVVYKVGRSSANHAEHEALTAWREAGASWAPRTSLWTVADGYGGDDLVLAMEYLPDDGGPVDEVTLAAIRGVAPQTCRENWTVNGGRVYLIDGGDIELYP